MPLIKSATKKALQKNIKTEMDANPGKEHMKQNLAIAYNTKRMASKRKKMASGGKVKSDDALVRDTADNAEDARGLPAIAEENKKRSNQYPVKNTLPSSPNGVAGKGDSATVMDTADNAKNTYAMAQLNEERKKMAKGGPASTNFQNEGEPTSLNAYTDEELKMEMRKRMADGGWIDDFYKKQAGEGLSTVDIDSDWTTDNWSRDAQEVGAKPQPHQMNDGRKDEYEVLQKAYGGGVEDEREDMDHSSITAAIMAKRKRMADGGQVDLEANSEESNNVEDDLNFDAIKKEQYDLRQLSAQPEDSNEIGDDDESESENKNDKMSIMRARMKAKRG